MNICKTEIPNCVGQWKQATTRLNRDTYQKDRSSLQTVLIKLPSICDDNETIHNTFTVMKINSNLSLDLQQFQNCYRYVYT